MIDLEKKGKKATGLKKLGDWIYKPDKDFWICRTKYNNFNDCPRCFYLDVVKGFKEPKPPGWALNSRTDGLLKKEFDLCREKEIKLKRGDLLLFPSNFMYPHRVKEITK